MLFKAKAANWKLETGAVEGVGRKLEIDNAGGVHINFRHFKLWALLMILQEAYKLIVFHEKARWTHT